MVVVRMAALALTAGGICALMLGDLYFNLASLSTRFAAQGARALFGGAAALLIGTALSCVSSRPRTRGQTKSRWAVRAFASSMLRGIVLGWLGFGALVYFIQDALVFNPRGLTDAQLQRIATQYPHVEPVEIVARDGAVLRGWLFPPQSNESMAPEQMLSDTAAQTLEQAGAGAAQEPGAPAPLVLLFAGQGGEVSRYFYLADRLPDVAWGFVNYRGYGRSDGTPSDKALFDDATVVYDYFASRPDIDARQVIALAGSMGTGVATYLASQRPLAGVILFSPYDSIGSGVAQDMLRWLPTRLFFRNRFDAADYAPHAQAPLLAVVGSDDTVIRPARSEALLRRWGGEYELLVIPGGNHYSIYDEDRSWEAVQRFVRTALGLASD